LVEILCCQIFASNELAAFFVIGLVLFGFRNGLAWFASPAKDVERRHALLANLVLLSVWPLLPTGGALTIENVAVTAADRP
jgi:hypothetical protein